MAFLQKLFKKKKQAMMTVCGLDAAGKTSVMNYLIYGEHRQTLPTMGINVNTINLPKLELNIFDLGGQENFRPLWSDINERSNAIIYIVDCTDYKRFDESKEAFHKIVNSQIDQEIPVMVLLNKCDLPNRISRSDFVYHFGLLELPEEISWTCYETSALTGKGLVEAFTQFIHQLEDEA